MYIHASKTLCTGVYKSQVHRLFYAHEGGLGPHTQDDPAGCVWGGGRGGGVRPAALSLGQLLSLCTALSFLLPYS